MGVPAHLTMSVLGAGAVDTSTLVSLIGGMIVALTAAVTFPLLMARRMDRQHREDRDADWARQDEVAARAAEQADLLKENTEQMKGQLRGIHTLVNSDMTAAMVDKLTALKGQAVALEEMVVMKRALLHEEPSSETLSVIARIREAIRETEVSISDRIAKTKIADDQIEEGGSHG